MEATKFKLKVKSVCLPTRQFRTSVCALKLSNRDNLIRHSGTPETGCKGITTFTTILAASVILVSEYILPQNANCLASSGAEEE